MFEQISRRAGFRRVANQSIDRRVLLGGAGAGVAGAVLGGLLGPVRSGSAQESTPVAPAAGPAIPPEVTEFANDWPIWHGDLAANRVARGSTIDASNVTSLEVAWKLPLTGAGYYGTITAPTLIVGETVYMQDMVGNVFALDRASGEIKWQTDFNVPTAGPNGLAIGYGMIFGPTGPAGDLFALDAATGKIIWQTNLKIHPAENLFGAPAVYDNIVYIGKESGYTPGSRSGLFAVDAYTGDVLWSFDTTTDNLWTNPALNSGGGIWCPPSFDEDGNIYIGIGNAAPFSGSEEFPNAGSRPGDNLYSSSMVSLDRETGAIRWHYQDRAHDLLDHDFHNTPVIAKVMNGEEERTLAIGAGKTGNVAAVDCESGQLIWKIPVGKHNAYGDGTNMPEDGELVEVWPGIYGGVETGMAYRDGTLYLTHLNMPSPFCATCDMNLEIDFNSATGGLIALDVLTAQIKWQVELPQLPFGAATLANDVIIVPLANGTVNAFGIDAGDLLWSYQAGAGFNAPPAIAGDLLIIGAGGPLFGETPADLKPESALLAFRLPSQ